MGLFPFFVDIKGARGLLIGGNKHAWEKLERLLPYGPHLEVIGTEFCPSMETSLQEAGKKVTVFRRDFMDSDLTPPPAFVVVSTGDAEEDHRISLLCQEQRIPVNVVDDQPYCTFIFPSLIHHGSLSIGISTAGASPATAVWLRKKVEAQIPADMEDILDWLQSKRPQILAALPQKKPRFDFYHKLTAICMEENRILPEEAFAALLDEATAAACR